ncbi:MAG: hypothetical protein RDV48_26335 [Candidatus Eremiobacteraeota bacterium]|nr:hypothetical protein [Candidatus Eremiobacteraeota bacterium]
MYNNPVSLPQMPFPGASLSLPVADALPAPEGTSSGSCDRAEIGKDPGKAGQAEKKPMLLLCCDALEKKRLLSSLVTDHTGKADVEGLISSLSCFPLSMITEAKEHGLIIHILKDSPKEGDMKPTDLGFGQDLDKNGKIEVGRWIDLNTNGTEDPGEREDLTSGGYSWNEVIGAYDTISNILFYKESEVNSKSDFHSAMIFHEFSHAVDDAMRNSGEEAGEWSGTVDKNYEAASANESGHGFVDGYAASDKGEYLAQSIAAYLIDKEIPEDPSNDHVSYFAPDNLTKGHLKRKDPAMHDFLEERFRS